MTPVGVAVWPSLHEPDSRFGDKPAYKVKLAFDPQTMEQVKKQIKATAAAAGFPPAKLPIAADKEHGEVLVAKSTYKPAQFDAKNQPVNLNIGGGSRIRISGTLNYYKAFGGGINIYVNSVQVLELQEGRDRGASPFEETEGYRFEADEDFGLPAVESASGF